jgi:hypothetical protein
MDGSSFNELTDMLLIMVVLIVKVAWPRGCTRNISQIDAIQTIKHLPLLIVVSDWNI